MADPLKIIGEILGDPAHSMRSPVNAGYLCPFINSECVKRGHGASGSYPVCSIHRSNPLMRIVLAGYQDEHQMPDEWRVEEWEAVGGYGLISDDEESTGRANKGRERLWLSPACVKSIPDQGALW